MLKTLSKVRCTSSKTRSDCTSSSTQNTKLSFGLNGAAAPAPTSRMKRLLIPSQSSLFFFSFSLIFSQSLRLLSSHSDGRHSRKGFLISLPITLNPFLVIPLTSSPHGNGRKQQKKSSFPFRITFNPFSIISQTSPRAENGRNSRKSLSSPFRITLNPFSVISQTFPRAEKWKKQQKNSSFLFSDHPQSLPIISL